METVQDRYFDALYSVAKVVSSTLDRDELLTTIVAATTKATGAKGCSLLLLDADKNELVHKAVHGLSDAYLRKGEVLADRSLADALKGETVAVSDVSRDPRVQYQAEAEKEGIGSILCVPLAARNRILGEMRTYHHEKQDFNTDTVRLVQAVASLSAIAIENSMIHDSLKRAHETCLRELWHLQP
jgi:GAF domain-containing protein